MGNLLTERAFLNCNIDPDFYYANLKTLALLFDNIVIWQPSETGLEKAGLEENEVVAGFIPGPNNEPPLLIYPYAEEIPEFGFPM